MVDGREAFEHDQDPSTVIQPGICYLNFKLPQVVIRGDSVLMHPSDSTRGLLWKR